MYEDRKFLNPESGLFENEIAHPFFTESISNMWKRFTNTAEGYQIRLNRTDRSSFLDSLMIYCRIHISGFYTPNSLAVIRQIFQ